MLNVLGGETGHKIPSLVHIQAQGSLFSVGFGTLLVMQGGGGLFAKAENYCDVYVSCNRTLNLL